MVVWYALEVVMGPVHQMKLIVKPCLGTEMIFVTAIPISKQDQMGVSIVPI